MASIENESARMYDDSCVSDLMLFIGSGVYGYVAWDLRSEIPEIAVFGRNEEDATEKACAAFGYRVRDYIAINCGPRDVVRVARAQDLDHYQFATGTPERMVARAAARLAR